MKTIELDPRVPGIRDEIPFPQAKQCSPELDSPVLSPVSVQSEITAFAGKTYRHIKLLVGSCLRQASGSNPLSSIRVLKLCLSVLYL